MTTRYAEIEAIPWFDRERYDAARLRMADADRLPDRYDVWLDHAEQRAKEAERANARHVERVYVDLDAFFAFCAERKIVADGKARQAFAFRQVRGWKPNVTSYSDPTFRHGRNGR